MIWPTIIVDNFFDEPNKVIEYSKKLNFSMDKAGSWPGSRTEPLTTIDHNFFNWVSYRIVRLLYPMNHLDLNWYCDQYFQKVNGEIYKNGGWVHCDFGREITAIIYLSKHKNCGTSLYTKKTMFNLAINTEKKEETYKTLNFKNEEKYLKENNEMFEKSLTIDSKFNRIVIFDSNQFHAADMFKDDEDKEERLTLITFFNSIYTKNIKYPITEMRRDF